MIRQQQQQASVTFLGTVIALIIVTLASVAAAEPQATSRTDLGDQTESAAADAPITMETFLDRLMQAESGGRIYARNAASTALGPYQFIASTWLYLARTAFATETAELKAHEVLDLRTDPAFARRAARTYTEANAVHLVANGHKATFANLRLAFLVGPSGAVRVLDAKSETPVSKILGRVVIAANPFMRSMTAEHLIARAARDIDAAAAVDTGLEPSEAAVVQAKSQKRIETPKVAVRCNLARPSCRRWLALAKGRATRRIRSASSQ